MRRMVITLVVALTGCTSHAQDLMAQSDDIGPGERLYREGRAKIAKEQKEIDAHFKAQRAACAKMVLPSIGDSYETALDAVESCWGKNRGCYTTLTSGHERLQCVFVQSGRYLYFDNRRLTAIQH
jgi:hypothetical protein